MLAFLGVVVYLVILGLLASLVASVILINLAVFPEPPPGHWARRFLVKRKRQVSVLDSGGARVPVFSGITGRVYAADDAMVLREGEQAHVPWSVPWALSPGQIRVLSGSLLMTLGGEPILWVQKSKHANAGGEGLDSHLYLYPGMVIGSRKEGNEQSVGYLHAGGSLPLEYQLLSGEVQ